MGEGLQAFVREDAYLKIFKAFAAGKHDLTKELLLSRLRKELEITDDRHSSLRQMVEDGRTLYQRDYESEAVAPKKATKPNKSRQQKRERVKTPEISDDDDEVEYKAVKRSQSRPLEMSTRPSRPNKRPQKDDVNGLDSSVPGMEGLEINRLIGYKVQRFWPEYGGWWDGVITDFKNGEHCIVYDLNSPKESYEWYDVSIARADEFRVSNEKINIMDHKPKAQPGMGKPANGLHAGRGQGQAPGQLRQSGLQQSHREGASNGNARQSSAVQARHGGVTPATPFVVESESESSSSDSESN